MVKEKKKYMKKDEVGICRVCGKNYDDYQQKHRRHICKECFNNYSKMAARKKASTIEGYFELLTKNFKYDKRRTVYSCKIDIDLQYLLTLFELQGGRCAISNLEMTWGFEDSLEEGKIYRRPFNASIDRIDSTKGYTKDNVVLVCSVVNFLKGNYPIGQMYEVADTIVKNKDRLKEVQVLMKEKIGVEINI